MTTNNKYGLKNIYIGNIWYMLAYAVDSIADLDLGDVDLEDVHGTNELLAVLLNTAYERLLNYDLDTDYHSEELLSDRPYGKLNLVKSYETGAISQGKIYCGVNTEDINSIYNQVIKAAFNILLEYDEKAAINNEKAIEHDTGKKYDRISAKNLSKINSNLDTLQSVDDIELYPELIDMIGGVPDRYSFIWVVIRVILYMKLAYDKTGKFCLLELNKTNKLANIFERFGLEFARKEYTGAVAYKPAYPVRNRKGEITRRNVLDMLLLGKTGVAIGDFKFYDKTPVEIDEANVREVFDYANSFLEEDKHASKYSNINCVLIYAYKYELDTPEFKLEETRDMKNDVECTIYKQFVDLSTSFDEIKQQLTNIYDKMLNINKEDDIQDE